MGKLIPMVFFMLLISCTDRVLEMKLANNPLPACPDTPNCMRTSYRFETHNAIELSSKLRQIIEADRNTEIVNSGRRKIHATYRIPVFGWIDDVHIELETTQDEATLLHIRSASRDGTWDLGVNKRRVHRIIRKLSYEYAL